MIDRQTLWSILITSFIVLLSFSVLGQTRTITGSGNWSNSSNWAGGNIGGAVDNDDDVVMNNGNDIIVQDGESYTIATLDAGKEGKIIVEEGGTLIITGDVNIEKEFTIEIEGSFNVGGDMDVAKEFDLVVKESGNFNISGDMDLAKEASFDIKGNMGVGGDLSFEKDADIDVDGLIDVDGAVSFEKDSDVSGSGYIVSASCNTNGSPDVCNNSQLNPPPGLPITLASFTATAFDQHVELNWTTLTEENFEYFEIQRASSESEFQTIETVSGSGNSDVAISYEWSDENPLIGLNYYRLISNDYDGYREIFDARAVMFQPEDFNPIAYPNSVKRGSELKIKGLYNQTAYAKIYDMSGNELIEMSLNEHQSIPTTQLKKGIYFLEISSNGIVERTKVIVK